MHRFSASIPVMVLIFNLIFLSLLALFPGTPARAENPLPPPPPASHPATLSFGSAAVLHGCWTDAELQGTPGEKTTRPASRPAPSPPPISAAAALPALGPEFMNSIRSVVPRDNQKLLALTFDLCEGKGEKTGYDGALVDFLRSAQVKATFFAGGKWLQSHPVRAMQLMADPLFEMGNHSWSHPNFRLIPAPAMREQILQTQAQYQLLRDELAALAQGRELDPAEVDKIPRLPVVFRFPYGACNPTALQVTAAAGLPAIQWSIVTADSWKGQSADRLAGLILKKARPGAIVIMHANGKGLHTAAALPLCLPQLRQQGYEFVTVSELLAAGRLNAADSCYEEKPGDNLRYDRPPQKTRRP